MDLKERLSLYKDFYKFELDVRKELDSAVTTPVFLVSVIVSLHVFVFGKSLDECTRSFLAYIATVNVILVSIAIFFLGRSFMNLGQTHEYEHVQSMDEYLNYWNDLDDQTKRSEAFSMALESSFAKAGGVNFKINNKRREDIAYAKKSLFWAVVFSMAFSLLYIINT